MAQQKIMIVVPVYNEEGNLEALYQRVSAVLKKTPYAHEFIFVDDGSRDNSWGIITRLARDDRSVKGISFSRNFGHQSALSAGLDHCAQADAVIMMDADLQHPPELIPELLKKWEEGYGVVYTLREGSPAGGFLKNAGSGFFYRLFNRLSDSGVPEGAADFRLISKDVLATLSNLKERTRFLRGMIHWMGYRSFGIPYKAPPRHSGRSKYSSRKMFKLAVSGISAFSTIPLYLAAVVGAVISLLSFLYAFYALYMKFVTHQVVPGWTSILVSVLFLGGIQLLAIGILGEYLAKIYEEVKGRPLYVVQDTIGLK